MLGRVSRQDAEKELNLRAQISKSVLTENAWQCLP